MYNIEDVWYEGIGSMSEHFYVMDIYDTEVGNSSLDFVVETDENTRKWLGMKRVIWNENFVNSHNTKYDDRGKYVLNLIGRC